MLIWFLNKYEAYSKWMFFYQQGSHECGMSICLPYQTCDEQTSTCTMKGKCDFTTMRHNICPKQSLLL